MERSVVQERSREQSPVVAVADADQVAVGVDRTRDQDAVLVDRPAGPVHPGALRELRNVDGDVDRDQRAGDLRAGAFEGRTLHAAPHALYPLGLAGVLGATDSDRRHRHAFGADRTSALRAGQPGDAIGMPVAGLFGHGHLCD